MANDDNCSPVLPVVRAQATVRPSRPRRIARPDAPRGVARVSGNLEGTRRIVPPPPPVAPVFVDDTGRRGRFLAWASVVGALIGLLLVVAFWVSQVTHSGVV
jgi:hypothetical protein